MKYLSKDGTKRLVSNLQTEVNTKIGNITSGTIDVSRIPNLDASKITSGTIDIDRLPQGALERLVTVANQSARFALTTANVQLGDTVKQTDTGVMYIVTDTANLANDNGYTEYTAGSATSVPWSGVTGKPSFASVATSGSYNDLTNTPTIPTVPTNYVTTDTTQTVSGQKTWTAINTFSGGQLKLKSSGQEIGVTPSTGVIQYLEFADKNNAQHGKVGLWDYDNGASEIQMSVSDKYKDGVKDSTGTSDTAFLSFGFQYNGTKFLKFSGQVNNSVIPLATNSYSLGSSSYQWASVYAQTYYYNGTQWGLDTFNQWTGHNKFISPNTNFGFKSTTAEAGSLTASGNWIYWQDKNDFQDAYISRDIWSNGSDSLRIAIASKRANGAPSTTGTEVDCGFRLNIYANGNTSIEPFDNGGTDLGSSTNQWKTLNGINPGALGFPNPSNAISLDTTNWDLTNYTVNSYTPPADGWIMLAGYADVIQIDGAANYGITVNKGYDGYCEAFLPVPKGYELQCRFRNCTTLNNAKFFPCQGNV